MKPESLWNYIIFQLFSSFSYVWLATISLKPPKCTWTSTFIINWHKTWINKHFIYLFKFNLFLFYLSGFLLLLLLLLLFLCFCVYVCGFFFLGRFICLGFLKSSIYSTNRVPHLGLHTIVTLVFNNILRQKTLTCKNCLIEAYAN